MYLQQNYQNNLWYSVIFCVLYFSATDLAHHLRIKSDVERMVSSGYDVSNDSHRELLLSLMMTASDLSDQTKNWTNSKETAVRNCVFKFIHSSCLTL
jgi:N-acetyl-anhydromuramyl-L-alanine amidase AmpD